MTDHEGNATENPKASGSWLRRHGGKLFASLVVAGAFAWLLHKGALPLAPDRSAFAHVKWWTVGGFIVMWCTVHVVRASRWMLLLRPISPVPYRKVLGVSFIGFAAIVLLPLRTGEAVRPLLIRTHGNISGWAATGTIAAERIIDGLVLSLMLLAGLTLSTPLSPLPDHIGNLPISPSIVPRSAYAALVLFGVAFTVMGVFYANRDWARRTTERVVGLVSPKLATWLADRVENIGEGLRFLPDRRLAVSFVGATIAYWMLNSASLWLIAWGTGFDSFTYAEACTTTGVIALGILVPNAPGFFGAYQLAFYAALAVFYPADLVIGPGAALVLMVYSAQLLITVAAAALGAVLERTGMREVLSEEASPKLATSAGSD
ncbi:MAG TPA: lysylphosphatidylglycerol synthase transmembrane domain-containing protein [Polyangiaceae bacterium]|nr:lysylphosphatidylglycerol synthase transmembrane domain-containing protein [Polyangiaceae bacterium]